MPTPATRTPVRLARGTYSNLNASIADILEGEAVYATDQDKVYVKEGGALVSTQADLSTYLTSAAAASTYQTQAAMSGYLDTATAASTYQTQAAMSGYVATGDIGTTVQGYDADTAKTDVAQTFTAAQRGTVVALTSGATITPDFAAAQNFSLTLGVNATLANPTNLNAGQSGVIVITNGAYTMAFGGHWKFPGGTAPSLTQSGTDVLAYYVDSSTRITARLIADVK